jgi:hypothetical protein
MNTQLTPDMKGKYVLIDLRDMDYFKDSSGIITYDTEEDARTTAGMYEFENVWICQLKFNHIENE